MLLLQLGSQLRAQAGTIHADVFDANCAAGMVLIQRNGPYLAVEKYSV